MRLQTGSRYDKIGFNQKLKGDGMMESYMQMLAKRSKDASRSAAKLGTADKNRGLLAVADELVAEQQLILDANAKDIEAAKKKGVKQSLIDRLELSERRIADMAEGLRQIAALDDPVGEVLSMKTRPNGLRIGQKRVPLGVVGIIYESRPNVTADAFGLCFIIINNIFPSPLCIHQAFQFFLRHHIRTVYDPVSFIPYRFYLISFFLELTDHFPYCRPGYSKFFT